MDQLVLSTNEKKELVYRLFEWAKSPTSSLIVIGIANTLDLPDRLLPQLSLKKSMYHQQILLTALTNIYPYSGTHSSAI